jgi:hypothetical protein
MSYPAPRIPETPSPTINLKLQTHFSSAPKSAFYAVIGSAVCGFFNAITIIYTTLTGRHAERDIGHMWMVSCALVSVAVCLAAWIAYTVILALSFVFHGVLYYGAIVVGLAGIAGSLAAVVFWKQDATAGKAGSGKGGEAHISLSSYRSASIYRSATTAGREERKYE